jgi:hypothetical protein
MEGCSLLLGWLRNRLLGQEKVNWCLVWAACVNVHAYVAPKCDVCGLRKRQGNDECLENH